ncbi:zinc finger MYM-type protein 5-like [Onthophagus taurus]|uniref:zinc finger MYM-type protein 5-like n=1 Tax=Onthophagus taurus TaxID=166361 RepID=UPI0039BE5904
MVSTCIPVDVYTCNLILLARQFLLAPLNPCMCKLTIKRITTPLARFFENVPSPSTSIATFTEEQKNKGEDKGENTDIKNSDEDLEKDNERSQDLNNTLINLKDPGLCPDVLEDKKRVFLIENKPEQIRGIAFPINNAKRSFSERYYNKILPNNELASRNWLLYSSSKDAVFCYNCKLFSYPREDSALLKGGYNDWGHLSEAVRVHENSLNHIKCSQQLILLKNTLKMKTGVDAHHQSLIDIEKQR